MSIKVLLAGPHAPLLRTLEGVLQQESDIDVTRLLTDPAETVSVATTLVPDVVVIDEGLPSRAGLDHLRHVVDQLPGVRILVLCLHAVRSFVAEVREAGASGYLLKDRAVEDLAAAIRAVAQSEFYVSPRVPHDGRRP